MTEADVKNYVKTQLGVSWVDVEAEDKDINTIIKMTLDKLIELEQSQYLNSYCI